MVSRNVIGGWIGLVAALSLALVGCDDASGKVQGGQSLLQTSTAGCSAACASPTWSCLYENCFGPAGQASCASTQGSCHQDGQQLGSQLSGFTCGGGKDACWQGLVFGPALPCFSPQDAGTDGGPDAEADAPSEATVDAAVDATTDAATDAPIEAGVEAGGDAGVVYVDTCAPDAGTVDPTAFPFFLALHQAPSSPDNPVCGSGNDVTFDCNMPCGDAPLTPEAGIAHTCHESKAAYTFTSTDIANVKAWITQGAQNN